MQNAIVGIYGLRRYMTAIIYIYTVPMPWAIRAYVIAVIGMRSALPATKRAIYLSPASILLDGNLIMQKRPVDKPKIVLHVTEKRTVWHVTRRSLLIHLIGMIDIKRSLKTTRRSAQSVILDSVPDAMTEVISLLVGNDTHSCSDILL